MHQPAFAVAGFASLNVDSATVALFPPRRREPNTILRTRALEGAFFNSLSG